MVVGTLHTSSRPSQASLLRSSCCPPAVLLPCLPWSQCPIVERLVTSLMFKARNSGKKLLAVRIVKDTFDIIHLLTDENPLQVFVKAIMNSGPREDSTRIGSAGVVRRQAVDVSPFRRVNQAIYLISHGVRFCSWGVFFFVFFFMSCTLRRPLVCSSHCSP